MWFGVKAWDILKKKRFTFQIIVMWIKMLNISVRLKDKPPLAFTHKWLVLRPLHQYKWMGITILRNIIFTPSREEVGVISLLNLSNALKKSQNFVFSRLGVKGETVIVTKLQLFQNSLMKLQILKYYFNEVCFEELNWIQKII